MKEYKIDADNKILGRLAVAIADILNGKNNPNFRPNLAPLVKVKVCNVAKLKYSGNKLKTKTYYRHSGYLGNLKSKTLQQVIKQEPGQALRQAVWGMLPKNKLRAKKIKKLIIE